MTVVLDYGVAPPASRDTRSLQELFTSLHNETVELGPRGLLVLVGVLFSSSATLLVRGIHWLYRKAAGYT
jgi:hypothetical protein